MELPGPQEHAKLWPFSLFSKVLGNFLHILLGSRCSVVAARCAL